MTDSEDIVIHQMTSSGQPVCDDCGHLNNNPKELNTYILWRSKMIGPPSARLGGNKVLSIFCQRCWNRKNHMFNQQREISYQEATKYLKLKLKEGFRTLSKNLLKAGITSSEMQRWLKEFEIEQILNS